MFHLRTLLAALLAIVVAVIYACGTPRFRQWTVAVRQALTFPEVSLGMVRFHLWKEVEEREPRPAAIDYPGPTVRASSPADYAELLSAAEV